MPLVLVSDTNIWIDFERAGLLEEIFRLSFEFCTTDFVCEELKAPSAEVLEGLGLRIISIQSKEIPALYPLRGELNNASLADVSCFYVARRDGRPLLTGDGRLRQAAAAAGLEIRGTLWLLDMLVEHAVISPDRAATALEQMLASRARLPEEECRGRIEMWRTAA